jgi:hypothetical protein
VAVAEHRLSVGDQHPLDRQLEQRRQRRAQVVVRLLRAEPALGAEPERLVGGPRLRAGAEEHVADHDGVRLRHVVGDL